MNHLVEDNSKRPNIGSRIIFLSFKDLRTHVNGSSYFLTQNNLILFVKFASEAKIDQNYPIVIDYDVFWLQITMHDALTNQIFQRFDYSFKNIQGLKERDSFLFI